MRNESTNNSIEYPTTSLHKESFPSHIATLPASTPEQNTQESDGNSSKDMDPSTIHMTCHTKQRNTQVKYTPTIISQSLDRLNTQDINQDTTTYKGKCQSSSTSKQKLITLWATHRPFIPNVATKSVTANKPSSPMHPHEVFSAHLKPFGTPIPIIDHTRYLQICAQNTQHNFKIYGDGLEMHNIINNLKILGVSMFAAISPNVNWKNSSNWLRTKQLFRPHFNQVHLSASSSDIGNDPL